MLFAAEVQVAYIARTLIAPLVDRRISTLEVKQTVENQWVNRIHAQLRGGVFEAGCSNWYINSNGRNSASWPGYASTFWKESLQPQWNAFTETPNSRWWIIHRIKRWAMMTTLKTYGFLGLLLLLKTQNTTVPSILIDFLGSAKSFVDVALAR